MTRTATGLKACPSGAGKARPRYERADPPPPLRFTARDGAILRFIHECDGVVAKRHLKERFWATATWRAMERRLSLLYHNAYLDWPTLDRWRACPVPEPVCWLGWRGALWLAGQAGLRPRAPARESASALARLACDLRRDGFRWTREPRWVTLPHDLAIVDVRLRVEAAVERHPHLELETWLAEGDFRANPDVIPHRIRGRDGRAWERRKAVLPDAVFALRDTQRAAAGQPARARFLLELDNTSHTPHAFGRDKAGPGAAYLESEAYRARFGDNAGRWLVVTRGGEGRLASLLAQAEQVAGAGALLFLFATWERLAAGNPLLDPLWWVAGEGEARPLFPG